MAHPFTVGIEEEFQIVDPATWELRSHVTQLLASSAPAFGDQVKREMHQSIVEVGTKICASIEELAEELIRIRRDLADAAERVGLRVAAAGTHPFSKIDLVYRRVLINDIVSREPECRALLDAYQARGVCVANSLRCKIPHKKRIFAVLTDDRYGQVEPSGG
jgi:hypothetical protein